MNETFESLTRNIKGNIRIVEQNFSNEFVSNKILYSANFIKLTFDNCAFDKVNFGGSIVVKCSFNNCKFLETTLKQANLEDCTFTNCQIIDSNFDKIYVDETIFNLCQFKNLSLLAGFFTNCKMIDCNFDKINSYGLCAIIVDSQISKFDRSVNFNGDFNFNKVLEFLESIPDPRN